MPGRLLLYFCLFLMMSMAAAARAAEPVARPLAERLLLAAGTAAVFDSPEVQAALASPQPYLADGAEARIEALLARSGFRPWQPPRVWFLQAQAPDQAGEGGARWVNLASRLEPAARHRGLLSSPLAPLPAANEALAFLVPGQPHPGLPGLLSAYEADVLVLLKGDEWTLWGLPVVQSGRLPSGRTDLLPDVIAEVVAASQQWPMARGRSVVQVYGVSGLADFAGTQAALQALPGARQTQLLRAMPDRLVFALPASAITGIQAALMNEPHLPVQAVVMPGLPSRVAEARVLAGAVMSRLWLAESPAPALPDASR